MGKIIFWLVVFFLALLVLRLINVANSRKSRDEQPRRASRGKDTAMTRCVNCGVYLPRAEAVEGPRGPLCGDSNCLPRSAGTRR